MIAYNPFYLNSKSIYVKKLTFLTNNNFFNKNNDFVLYFLFIYDYIHKNNYIKILLQIFVMEFVREYLLRTSKLLLFEIKEDKENKNYDFYIILFFVTIRILNNIYIKYKYNFDRKY